LDFLDVGRANTAGRDFDQQFAWPNSWHRDGFEPQIIGAVVNYGLHVLRDH
jgi:hypothetical protein